MTQGNRGYSVGGYGDLSNRFGQTTRSNHPQSLPEGFGGDVAVGPGEENVVRIGISLDAAV